MIYMFIGALLYALGILLFSLSIAIPLGAVRLIFNG